MSATNHFDANAHDKPQALIVDDDESILDFLQSALKRLGYEVTRAEDGLIALNLCRDLRFDLIICDIRMPRLNGLSFITQVNLENPDLERCILVLSSLDDMTVRRDALKAGANGYLVKPLSTARLSEALNRQSWPQRKI